MIWCVLFHVWRTAHSSSECLILLLPSQGQQPNAGQGRLLLEVSESHTMTHHSRWNSSRQGIGPSQSPLPDNKQHIAPTRDKTSMPLEWIEPAISASERSQTLTLDQLATGIRACLYYYCITSHIILGERHYRKAKRLCIILLQKYQVGFCRFKKYATLARKSHLIVKLTVLKLQLILSRIRLLGPAQLMQE